MHKDVKIGIVGAGGVGGYYGGLLAKAGMGVHFLARGEQLRAIRESGLKVKSYKGDFEIKEVQATKDPAKIGVCDIILFCVKSFDTRVTAELIKPMVGPSTTILSLQNGIENEETLGSVLGEEKIMGGVAFIGSHIGKPGVILHTAAGNMTFGELDGGMSERGGTLLKLLEEAGIEARLTENIKKTMWQKMVWNCGFNAITALTGCTAAEVLAMAETRETIKGTMFEVVEVAKRLGIDLSDDLPEKTIAHTEKQGQIKTSMLMDMKKGNRLEIEALNGAVSRAGKSFDLYTPVNDALHGMIKAVNSRRGF